MGTTAAEGPDALPRTAAGAQRETGPLAATSPYGSDGTRTRDLRRDRSEPSSADALEKPSKTGASLPDENDEDFLGLA
jgi:hypothetical protein